MELKVWNGWRKFSLTLVCILLVSTTPIEIYVLVESLRPSSFGESFISYLPARH